MSYLLKSFVYNRLNKIVHSRPRAELAPLTICNGYALQSSMQSTLEIEKGPIVGHKIGCTTEIMQKYLDINTPCAGGLYKSEVFSTEKTLSISNFLKVGVECEIGVRLGTTLSKPNSTITRAEVIEAVDSLMVALEIVEDRYDDFRAFGTPLLIADDFFSAGAILGPLNKNWNPLNLKTIKATLLVNGNKVAHGYGKDVMGHPFSALHWLANLKNKQNKPLLAGNIILTGSIVQTKWINEPCKIEGQIMGLDTVKLTITK